MSAIVEIRILAKTTEKRNIPEYPADTLSIGFSLSLKQTPQLVGCPPRKLPNSALLWVFTRAG